MNKTTIFAITGKRGVGKTTFLVQLATQHCLDGYRVGGFFQKRILDDAGKTIRYELVRWSSRESQIIASLTQDRQYRFNDEAFRLASSWLIEDAGTAQLLILDEIGRLELNGQGHAPALLKLLSEPVVAPVIATLRKDMHEQLATQFSIARECVWDLDTRPANVSEFRIWLNETVKQR